MCQLLVLHTCFIDSPLYLSIRDRYDLHYILPWQMNSCFTNLSSWDRFFPDSSDFPDISYISPWQMNSCFTNLRQIFPDSSDFPDIYYITPWQMNSCFTKQISKATINLTGQIVMYTGKIWRVVEKNIFNGVLPLTTAYYHPSTNYFQLLPLYYHMHGPHPIFVKAYVTLPFLMFV